MSMVAIMLLSQAAIQFVSHLLQLNDHGMKSLPQLKILPDHQVLAKQSDLMVDKTIGQVQSQGMLHNCKQGK